MCRNIEYRICKYGWHLNGSFVGQITKCLTGALCRRSSCEPPHDKAVIIWLNRDESFSNKGTDTCSDEGQTFSMSIPRWHDMTCTSLSMCTKPLSFRSDFTTPTMTFEYVYELLIQHDFQLLLSDNKHNCGEQNITLHFDFHSLMYLIL
jgi:hypothetical protein